MKFIVKSDFRKTPGIEVESGADPENPAHIPMGAIITIGKEGEIENLSGQEVKLVAQLNAANRIADANDPKAVKWVNDQVAAERKRIAGIDKAKTDAGLRK